MKKVTLLLGISLILIGCVSVPAVREVQPGDPELSVGSIVFGGIDGNLYATRGPNEIVQLTRRGGDNDRTAYGAYAWSGDRVVFAAQELAANNRITGFIYSVVPGGQPRRLVRRADFAPFFIFPSPDNDRVAYLGSVLGGNDLLMGSVDGQGRHDVVHGTGQPFYAAWSPDGATMITHVGLPFGATGSVMQFQSVSTMLEGGSPGPALNLRTGNFQAPAFSPDGEFVAVALLRDGSETVSIISPEGSLIRDIATVDGIVAMAWSPEGNQIAFIDGRFFPTGGISGPLLLSGPDNRLRRIADQVGAFFWSPDGSRILYLEPFFVGAGAAGTLLYRVSLYRLSTGEPEVMGLLRPAQAFVRQIVPFFDQYLGAYTIWSPDSRLIVLNSTRDDGVPLIHLVDTERYRIGGQFAVDFTLRVQNKPEDGLITEDGFTSRVLSPGTNPFFSREKAFSLPGERRPGIGS